MEVRGAEQMYKLGRDLRAAGDVGKGLRLELLAALRAAEAPLRKEVTDSALRTLPHKGGLNQWVARARPTVSNRLTGRAAGIRVKQSKKGHDLPAIDEGRVRHPLFGNRKVWYALSVPEGYFTKPLNKSVPRIRTALLLAIETTNRRIARGA